MLTQQASQLQSNNKLYKQNSIMPHTVKIMKNKKQHCTQNRYTYYTQQCYVQQSDKNKKNNQSLRYDSGTAVDSIRHK